MIPGIRARLAAAAVACLVFVPGASPHATAAPGDSARYVSGGTAAVRADGQTVADEGSVVCDDGNGVGVGGFCLGFGGGDAIKVVDDTAGEDVAFQVCVDNSGDGVCTSPDFGACADVVVFSHDDNGAFYNPVGPVPDGFTPGCAGGPWQGYVVFLCNGVHAVGGDSHSHPASAGAGEVVSGGEGQGTFCGGSPVQQSRKPYTLGSGARYVSGGTAVVREDGQTTADEGAVVCNNGDNVGVGGFCVPFAGDAVAVFDAALGEEVAFQACVDNNGDGVCSSPDFGPCADVVAFSHDDNGAFYNPVGPLPTGFTTGCPGGPWKGFVVFLCEGAHIQSGVPHSHPPTTGTGRVTTGGEGLGTFCGGSEVAQSRKRYATTPQAALEGPACRLVSATDPNPEAPDGTLTGFVEGGPILESGTLTCTVQIGGARNNDPNNGASASATGTNGVTTLPTTLVSFSAPPEVPVFLCTQFTGADGTPTFFDAESRTFTTDPSAPCALAIEAGTDDPVLDPATDLADALVAVTDPIGTDFVDPLACPLLATLAGSYGVLDVNAQGDVFVNGGPVLDCPPYDLPGSGGPQVAGVRVVVAGYTG